MKIHSTYAETYISKKFSHDNLKLSYDVKEIDWNLDSIQLCMPDYHTLNPRFDDQKYMNWLGIDELKLKFPPFRNKKVIYDIDYIYQNINENTKVALMLPSHELFLRDTMRYKPSKRELIEKGYIYSVIQLPAEKLNCIPVENRYVPRKALNSLIIFTNNNKHVNIFDQVLCEKIGVDEFTFNLKELMELKYCLIPSFCITNKIFRDYKVRLSDIADVQLGCNTIRFRQDNRDVEQQKDNEIYLVSLKDIDDSGINSVIEPTYVKNKEKYHNSRLFPGDIVFPSKGVLFKSGIVDQDEQRELIASSNLHIIRAKDGIMPEFILAYLNSNMFNFYIQNLCSYSYFSAVRVDYLLNAPIAISNKDFEKMHDKTKVGYVKFRKTYKDLLKQIKYLEDYQNNEIYEIFDKDFKL